MYLMVPSVFNSARQDSYGEKTPVPLLTLALANIQRCALGPGAVSLVLRPQLPVKPLVHFLYQLDAAQTRNG